MFFAVSLSSSLLVSGSIEYSTAPSSSSSFPLVLENIVGGSALFRGRHEASFFRFFFLPTGCSRRRAEPPPPPPPPPAFTAIYRSVSYVGWIRGGFSRGSPRVCPGCAIALRLRILRNHSRTRPRLTPSNRTSRCASHPLLFEEGISQSNTSDARRAQAPELQSVLTLKLPFEKVLRQLLPATKTISRPSRVEVHAVENSEMLKLIISFYVFFFFLRYLLV